MIDVGPQPANVYAIDWNRDTFQDIISVGFNVLSIALGNGNGTFQTAVQLTNPNNANEFYGSFAVGDITGDLYPDVVIASSSNSELYIFTNAADGTAGAVEKSSIALTTYLSTFNSLSGVQNWEPRRRPERRSRRGKYRLGELRCAD